ncbi:MAG TPA: hypothetical protein VMR34_03915 [Candidatus Saccharimonadales bacterium]|nr:hypothetical protein [Candidatus Saccharimonadales bacterium]
MKDSNHIDFGGMLYKPKLLLKVDELEVLERQHQSGLSMLEAKGTMVFYVNTSRTTNYMELVSRLSQQRSYWRKDVLNNLKLITWLPKRLESRFASNKPPLLDPHYTAPDELIKQFFDTLQDDIDLIAEVIDYGKTIKADKENDQSVAMLVVPSYYRDKKQLVFCNKIIDVSKGKDFALLCNAMFYNEKPRKQPQSLGDLLEKWQDPDYKNTKRVHNAVNNLNGHIAKSTTVKDLFYIKNVQVHFNSRYS